MKFALLLVAVLLGCTTTKPNPASCADNHCNDPALPFCDVDGSIGGEPNTCIAVDCMPGAFEACRDDRALMCNATGDNYDLVDCMYGCSSEAGGCNACNTSDCEKHIIPRYLPTICNQTTNAGAWTVVDTTVIDTTNCTHVVAQPGGPDLCVFHWGQIRVGGELIFRGPRAIALVADSDLLVDGIVDVSAQGGASGPGGGLVDSGAAPGYQNGGGGAGFKTTGAPGGSDVADGGANNGGSTSNPALSVALLGGTQPPAANALTPRGGGGGGAMTVISCRGTVSIDGVIEAGGGGGPTQRGGGSGGYVVLQGMNVIVKGEVYANGGAGGGDGNGEDGARSTMPAMGGYGITGGAGGAGASANSPAGPGKRPVNAGQSGGGGGGGLGYFQAYTQIGQLPVIQTRAASPPFEPGGMLPTN